MNHPDSSTDGGATLLRLAMVAVAGVVLISLAALYALVRTHSGWRGPSFGADMAAPPTALVVSSEGA